jgi:hypothetical protein
MDQNQVVNKKGNSNQPGNDQTQTKSVDFQTPITPGLDQPSAQPGREQPLGPSLSKEQEKIPVIESRAERITEGEEIPELGPEFKEIKIPEKLTPTLPSEVVEIGVTPVVSPTLPGDLTPPAQTVVLPLTKEKSKAGLALPVVASFRWLTEWCLRLIKITRGKARYVFRNPSNHEI